MKPVQQTKKGPLRGDCLAACVASIFEVDITKLPALDEYTWHKHLRSWLWDKGFSLMYIEDSGSTGVEPPDGISIACHTFYVERGQHAGEKRTHCVVTNKGLTIWDPWDPLPGSGCFSITNTESTSWIVFTVLDPSQFVKKQ